MSAPYILIWFDAGKPLACELANLPNHITYKGRIFEPQNEYFGDVDYLRDEQQRLIGFAYVIGGKRSKFISEKLISKSENVKIDAGMLLILFKEVSYEVECVQAMGTEIFSDSSNEIIIAIPNWGFRNIAFDLTLIDVPTPIN